MNDFQMNSLASTHVAGLRDEAVRQRLANASKPSHHSTSLVQARRPLVSSLISLVARVVA
jgi:hypothetical protein